MNTAVINVKTDPIVKKKAQRVAHDFGFSLSALINGYLRQLIKTKTVIFSASERPTEYLLEALKESEKDIREGRVSPTFTNARDAIKWLNDPKRRFTGKPLKKI